MLILADYKVINLDTVTMFNRYDDDRIYFHHSDTDKSTLYFKVKERRDEIFECILKCYCEGTKVLQIKEYSE